VSRIFVAYHHTMKTLLKIKLLSLILTLGLNYTLAQSFTTTKNGKWSNNKSWENQNTPGSYWGSTDTVFIRHNIDLDDNIGFAGVIIIENGGKLIGSNRELSIYSGGSIFSNGKVDIKSLTLNNNTTAYFYEEVELKNDLTIGQGATANFDKNVTVDGKLQVNGGTASFQSTTNIGNHFENNNGTVIFNDDVNIFGHFTANNSNAKVTAQKNLTVNGHLTLNSGAELVINQSSQTQVKNQLRVNSNSILTNNGKITVENHGVNNGGTIENIGQIIFEKQFTQNSGLVDNDGVIIIHDRFTLNGGANIIGDGLLRMDNMTIYGSLVGNDICNLNDDNTPQINGNGSISQSTTYCQQSLSAALPIELDYFNVEKGFDNQVSFNWRTLSEINNNIFEVEYSANGEAFYPILRINGAGNSNQAIEYSELFTFQNGSPSGYYRLKQTDFDGKYSYSDIVYLQLKQKETKVVSVYPNPTDGRRLFVELQNLKANEYVIDLLNSSGVLIVNKTVLIGEEDIYFETELLHGKQLDHGLYYLRISSSKERYMEKIIVE